MTHMESYSTLSNKEKCLQIYHLRLSWNKAKADVTKVDVSSSVLSAHIVHHNTLLLGLNSGFIQEWTLQGAFRREKEVHQKGVKVITSNKRGDIVTGSYDGSLAFWDENLFLIRRIQLAVSLTDILFDEDNMIVCGDEGKVWSFLLGAAAEAKLDELWRRDGGEMINCLAVFTFMDCVVTGCDNGDLLVLDKQDGRQTASLQGHQSSCGITAAKQDGQFLWSASFDCTIRLWSSVDSWKCLAVLRGHTHPVRAIQVTGANLVSGDYRGFVMVWSKSEVHDEVQRMNKSKVEKEQPIYKLRHGRVIESNPGLAEVVQHSSFLEHNRHVTSLQANIGYLVSGSRDKSFVVHKFMRERHQAKTFRGNKTNYFDNFTKY